MRTTDYTRPSPFVTGGAINRQYAEFAGCGYHALLISGPLDAPCWMPAGAMNSTAAKDWKQSPIVDASLSVREG